MTLTMHDIRFIWKYFSNRSPFFDVRESFVYRFSSNLGYGTPLKRGYRNRDYMETIEGLIFTVVGDVHPLDRVLAYLKYVPDSKGAWGIKTMRYDRALKYYSTLHVKGTFDFLRKLYPEYLYNSKTLHLLISAIPLSHIRVHHCPESRLSDLFAAEHLDPLETKAVRLAETVAKESHVDHRQIGITGSILVGIHNPTFSDIDLTVYGKANSLKVKSAVQSLLSSGNQGLHPFDDVAVEKWLKSRGWLYPLEMSEVERIYRRHWNRGIYEGTEFSIHPGIVETEIGEKYGDKIYSPEGIVDLEAIIDDAREAAFMPGTYRTSEVRILNGPAIDDINEIVTYEGFYSDIVSVGERVRARGKLEKVFDKRNGYTYHRIVIGAIEAEGMDYLQVS